MYSVTMTIVDAVFGLNTGLDPNIVWMCRVKVLGLYLRLQEVRVGARMNTCF